MRRVSTSLLALLVATMPTGCSFIRDFSRFEVRDAGAVNDAGSADAASDAGSMDAARGAAPGEPCSAASTPCEPGSDCEGEVMGDGGVCRQRCGATADCTAQAGTVCDNSPRVLATGQHCLCEPVAQVGCPPGQACYFDAAPDAGIWTVCAAPGSRGPGAACVVDPDCEPHATCAPDPNGCRTVCREDVPCGAGSCNDFSSAFSDYGGHTYGYCFP